MEAKEDLLGDNYGVGNDIIGESTEYVDCEGPVIAGRCHIWGPA